VLIVLSGVLNYLDRQALAVVSPTLKHEFQLTDARWGWVNSAFSLVYLFSTAWGGAWVDRVGVRKGLLISTIVWSIATAGHAFATDFWSLCFWRMALAVGEGPGNASLLKGMRRLMPPHLRDTGTGLVGAGTILGALVAPLTVVPLAVRFGWQAAFVVSGGFSLLWLPFWTVLSASPRAGLGAEAVELRSGSDEKPRRLDLSSKALWATLLAIFFTVPPTVFVQTFLPLYLTQQHHLTQAQVGAVYWQPFLATDLGQLFGGACAYMLLRRGWRFLSARRAVMIAGFLGSTMLLTMLSAPDAGTAMLRLDLSRFLFQTAYTVLLAYGIESVAEGQTGRMHGLMNATFSACNFVFNPLIGGISDRFHSYNPVIVLVGLSPLLGLACWLALSHGHARESAASAPAEGSASG
jgi:ACS family hexuronate transporter-like MFS transporter